MYKGIIELCMIKYRDSEGLYVGLTEAAFCTARSQLLMYLHDTSSTEICKEVRPRGPEPGTESGASVHLSLHIHSVFLNGDEAIKPLPCL